MIRLTYSFAVLLALLTPVSSFGTTLSFDEFGTTSPIEGNKFQVFGVTLGLSPDSALYNGMIGSDGNAVWAQDPLLTGPTSDILTLTFAIPTEDLAFDIVLQSIVPIGNSKLSPDGGPAYTVTLSTGGVFNEGTAPQPAGVYSEGQFLYRGPAITAASIGFFQGQDDCGGIVQAFGLDNLTYDTAVTSEAPEPGTLCLIGLGLVALALTMRRSREAVIRRRNHVSERGVRRRVRLVRQE